MYLTQLAL